ncbi:hypothetical protein GYMLUDRAFT_109655, partial [Collybiopsis luxurians FD-317 M1]
PVSQRGFKGNVIIFPQQPGLIASLLPPSIDELISPICVMFVGSTKPTPEWICNHAKPLSVRPAKVRSTLKWLKSHNPLYKNIEINDSLLDSLPDDFILPAHVEYMASSSSLDSLTTGYDPIHIEPPPLDTSELEIPFDSIVITDVDGNSTVNQLQAATVRHFKSGGSFVQIPHDPQPINEFFNPVLFPMIYPTLFPYGIGGFKDYKHSERVSLKRHGKHLL